MRLSLLNLLLWRHTSSLRYWSQHIPVDLSITVTTSDFCNEFLSRITLCLEKGRHQTDLMNCFKMALGKGRPYPFAVLLRIEVCVHIKAAGGGSLWGKMDVRRMKGGREGGKEERGEKWNRPREVKLEMWIKKRGGGERGKEHRSYGGGEKEGRWAGAWRGELRNRAGKKKRERKKEARGAGM